MNSKEKMDKLQVIFSHEIFFQLFLAHIKNILNILSFSLGCTKLASGKGTAYSYSGKSR